MIRSTLVYNIWLRGWEQEAASAMLFAKVFMSAEGPRLWIVEKWTIPKQD